MKHQSIKKKNNTELINCPSIERKKKKSLTQKQQPWLEKGRMSQ